MTCHNFPTLMGESGGCYTFSITDALLEAGFNTCYLAGRTRRTQLITPFKLSPQDRPSDLARPNSI
jgi:hypothetical protein